MDLWIGDCPLSVEFNQLYKHCRDPNILVNDVCGSGMTNIEFRRSLNKEELEEWTLVELVNQVTLTPGRDESFWVLEKKAKYTTKSLYAAMTFGGVKDSLMMKAWNCRIPLKIKLFLWMAFHDKIQSAVQLRKRKWAGPEECKLCGERETTDHILFMCPVANFMWILIRDICGLVSAPTTCAELAEILVHRRASRFGALFLFLCAGALWAIWKTRNALVFDDKLMKNPPELVHKTKAFLLNWKPLLRQADKAKLDDLLQALMVM